MPASASAAAAAARNQLQATIVKSGLLKTNAGVVPRPSPSLFYFPGITSKPVHAASTFHWARVLEEEHATIKKEYLNLRADKIASDYTQHDGEHSLHQGKWDWHSYVLKGQIQPLFAEHCPETSRLLQEFHKQAFLMLGTPFSFSFFSTLHAQSAIAPHSGPSNLRLRCHLPLIVPKAGGKAGGKEGGSRASSAPAALDGPPSPASSSPPMDEYESLEDIQAAVPCGMRIGDQVRAWEEGKCLVLDDAYEHEVWNHSEEERVLLLVDFWHPEIEREERAAIQGMFDYAAKQGWMKGGSS